MHVVKTYRRALLKEENIWSFNSLLCLFICFGLHETATFYLVISVSMFFKLFSSLLSFQHMKSPSVSCLDVDSSHPTNDPIPSALTPSTPVKSHRRSVSCGNNPTNNNKGSGPDMRIVRIRMDLQDGNMYRSILVLSRDNGIFLEICLFWYQIIHCTAPCTHDYLL